jgi:hypothetical protein
VLGVTRRNTALLIAMWFVLAKSDGLRHTPRMPKREPAEELRRGATGIPNESINGGLITPTVIVRLPERRPAAGGMLIATSSELKVTGVGSAN